MSNFQALIEMLSHIEAHVASAIDQVEDTSSELFENLNVTLDHCGEVRTWLTIEYLEALFAESDSE